MDPPFDRSKLVMLKKKGGLKRHQYGPKDGNEETSNDARNSQAVVPSRGNPIGMDHTSCRALYVQSHKHVNYPDLLDLRYYGPSTSWRDECKEGSIISSNAAHGCA